MQQRGGEMFALHLQVGLLDIGDASTVQALQRQLWDFVDEWWRRKEMEVYDQRWDRYDVRMSERKVDLNIKRRFSANKQYMYINEQHWRLGQEKKRGEKETKSRIFSSSSFAVLGLATSEETCKTVQFIQRFLFQSNKQFCILWYFYNKKRVWRKLPTFAQLFPTITSTFFALLSIFCGN